MLAPRIAELNLVAKDNSTATEVELLLNLVVLAALFCPVAEDSHYVRRTSSILTTSSIKLIASSSVAQTTRMAWRF